MPRQPARFPDYDALDQAYDVLDRVKDRRGLPAAVDLAQAMVFVGKEIEAGRVAVTKSATGPYGISYKATQNPLDAACERLKERLRRTMGDDAAAVQVDKIADGLDPSGGAIGVQMNDTAKMKDDKVTPAQRAARSVYPELYPKGARR